MRNTSTWTDYAPGSEPALFVAGRGFTGHEHLPWFNLINMNGRVYDPLTGQFLTPDNSIQFPFYTQNFNRYLYCLNNPMIYVDPSGLGSEKKKAVIKLDNEIEITIDYLFYQISQSGGGGSLTYFPGTGETYASPAGSNPGFSGPNNPYPLGEVTVTANAPLHNMDGTSNNDNPFSSQNNNSTGNNNHNNNSGGLTHADNDALLAISAVLTWVQAIPSGAAKPFIKGVLIVPASGVAITGLIGNYNLAKSPNWEDRYHYGMMTFFVGLSFTEVGAPISLGYSIMDSYGLLDGEYQKANFLQKTGYWLWTTPTGSIIPIHVFNIKKK